MSNARYLGRDTSSWIAVTIRRWNGLTRHMSPSRHSSADHGSHPTQFRGTESDDQANSDADGFFRSVVAGARIRVALNFPGRAISLLHTILFR